MIVKRLTDFWGLWFVAFRVQASFRVTVSVSFRLVVGLRVGSILGLGYVFVLWLVLYLLIL